MQFSFWVVSYLILFMTSFYWHLIILLIVLQLLLSWLSFRETCICLFYFIYIFNIIAMTWYGHISSYYTIFTSFTYSDLDFILFNSIYSIISYCLWQFLAFGTINLTEVKLTWLNCFHILCEMTHIYHI